MNYEEYILISSEVSELESILQTIPASSKINRIGFEFRLKKAKAELEKYNIVNLPKKARLTFRGRPVFGSHGVAAEFATKASGFFTEAFSAVAAALDENLKYMGRIPDKAKNQLLITGTAIGSFGFEYELPAPENPVPADQKVLLDVPQTPELAMEKVERLLAVSAEGSDDDIAEVVDEIHPRAVKKVAEFLEYIAGQEAWCGIEFKDQKFRFEGLEQVRRSFTRLTSQNIKSSDVVFHGEFQGCLPKGRTFEFKLRDKDEILKGKIGPEIVDADVLNREYLHKPLQVSFSILQVGHGRPRYTLLKLESIEATPPA